MGSLKEVRDRITSVSSTKQITSAMKMVSAAKLRRAQDAVTRMRPFSEKLTELLQNLSADLDPSDGGVFSEPRPVENVLIIPISSNRGLCGGFNANIIKATNKLIGEYKGKTITILCAGKKADDYYKKTEYYIKGTLLPRNFNNIFDDLTYDNASSMVEVLMGAFEQKQFDRIHIIYNRFKNAAVQIVSSEQLLPLVPPVTENNNVLDYLYEPNKKELVKKIIPKSLKTQFFKAVLDSFAAEHGARMTAMHKATDNAEDMLKELKLSYNKARQASITGEILEIVGGAEALN